MADIDEAACANLVLRKCIVIADNRAVIVVTGRDLTEVRRGQCLARERLELHDVEHLVGRADWCRRRYSPARWVSAWEDHVRGKLAPRFFDLGACVRCAAGRAGGVARAGKKGPQWAPFFLCGKSARTYCL